jgi:hypothetical protein
MSLNIIFKKCIYLLFVLTTLSSLTSCEPDRVGTGNGLSDLNVDPSFTITPVAGKVNVYLLESGKKDVLNSYWKVGKTEYFGKMAFEISLPDAGKYTVEHTAVGRGGTTNIATKEIIVATSDPEKGNLVKGGNFSNAADQAQWTILNLSTTGEAFWSFANSSATIHSSGGWAQEAIYQAIDVVKDKEYTIDMLVSSSSGSNDTWFEVYAGKSMPVSGVEYKDNKVMGLSTWDGCAKTAFSGMLSIVGCTKNSVTGTVSNVVKFTETGKIYLLIRSGGSVFTPNGITVTDIELRGK